MTPLQANLWDSGSLAGAIGAIADALEAERGEPVPIQVNVSMGPRPAIGASIASMFWDAHLFHPKGEAPAQVLSDANQAVELPAIKARLPGPTEQFILAALLKGGGKTTGIEVNL